MRRTSLGDLVLAIGWGSFVVAIVAGTVAPALLGVVLVASVLAQRVNAPVVKVTRILPDEVVEGEPFEVVVEAVDAQSLPLFIEQDIPHGVALIEVRAEPGRGKARLVTHVRATRPGVVSWRRAHVRAQDAWGVVEEELTLAISDHVRVRPDTSGVSAGRYAAKRTQVGVRTRRRLASDWEPEIERLRDYQPGDRMRAIDWAHSTKLDKLIARELTRQSTMPVVLLLQATESVRYERRTSKLATGIQCTLGVMSAAQTAGVPAGLVAYDDRGVRAQVRVSASRQAVSRALHALSEMPPTEARLEVAAPHHLVLELAVPTAQERAFLAAIATFDPSASRGVTPLEAALGAVARVSSQPALVICFLDVEEVPALAKTVVQRLTRHGHRCVVVGFASGAHHYSLRSVDDAVLDSLVRWRRNREHAASACGAMRAPFTTIGPIVSSETIREVIRSAR